jgi:hypothetical protein
MAEAYMRPRIVSVQKVTQEHNNREQVAIFLSYRQHRPIPLPRRLVGAPPGWRRAGVVSLCHSNFQISPPLLGDYE